MSASDQEDLEHGLFSGIPVPWESVLGLIKVWFSHVRPLVSACESREDSKLSISSLVYWWRLHPSCQKRTGLPSLSYPSVPSQTCLHLPHMFVDAAISFEDANPNKTVLTLRPSVSVQDETISKELAAALKQLGSRGLFRSSLLGLLPLGPIDSIGLDASKTPKDHVIGTKKTLKNIKKTLYPIDSRSIWSYLGWLFGAPLLAWRRNEVARPVGVCLPGPPSSGVSKM